MRRSAFRSTKSVRRPELQTRLTADKLEKRLTKIFRDERTLAEEQGVSTLYLALGFLKWFDSEQSEESFAPLILVPVTMDRVPGGDGYLLRGRDDEIVPNISLREKLKTDFGIQLSEIPDDEEWKPSSYFNSASRQIMRQPRWQVDSHAVGLGFFTFSKFMMWRDLDPTTWANNALIDHPLLNVLLGNNASFETLPPLVPEDQPIDERIDLSKCPHVVNADSSQAIVIEEARAGRNLVVQGPPGTGKSQTITNIIASAVHSGKTVLFVAEKTAALGVVHDRLKKAGVGALCLEMHSRKANKREVLASLEEALRFPGTSQLDTNLAVNLACCRDKLNRWSKTIHNPIGQTGRSAFHVIGQQLKLRTDRVRLLDIRLDEAAEWSATKLSAVETAVTRASDIVLRHRVIPKDHPWFATNIASQSPFDLDRLVPKLRTAIDTLDTLSRNLKKVFTHIAEDREPHIADAFATVKALRHLATVPEESRRALIDPAWLADLAVLENAIQEGERLTVVICEIEEQFRHEAWTFDTGALLLALRVDGPSFLRRFSRRYREANANLRAICRGKPPKALKNRIVLVETLQKAQQDRYAFARKEPILSSALGSLWAELKTCWAAAQRLIAWVRRARSELGGPNLLTLAARTRDLGVFSEFAEKLEISANSARSAFEKLYEQVQPDIQALFGTSDYDRVPIAQLTLRVSSWLENSSTINDWVEIRDVLSHLQAEGLRTIAGRLIDGTIHPSEARPITDLLISEALWQRATVENPEITSIDGNNRTEQVSEFRKLDQQRIKFASHEVITRYLEQRPSGYAGEMGIVRAEIDKKRGHRALRKLMSDAGSAIQRLKPVFLMSPLSVAQFIQPGRLSFDLLVIDEASQVAQMRSELSRAPDKL
jgi:hypothetical protein